MAPAIRVNTSPRQQASVDTLVLYTFSASDSEYRANFEYFLKFGVGGDNVFYAIILQQASLSASAHIACPGSGAAQDLSLACYGQTALVAAHYWLCLADV